MWWHVRLETEDGLSGLGEATVGAAPADFGATLARAAAALVGRPLGPRTMAPLAGLLGQGLAGRSIHAGLDQAVCDLHARARDLPLCSFLAPGAVPGRVPLYANINRATADRRPGGFAANARRAVAEGHRALKIAAFDDLTPALCGTDEGAALIAAGLARLRAVAGAQDAAELRVDCHWRLTPGAAFDLLPALAEIGVVWLECPLPETAAHIADLRRLRAAANRLGIRLCGLESFGGWAEVAPFVEGGAYDVVMPDVKHAGRLSDILEIARNAARHDVQVSLHNPTGPVSHAVSTHVSRALGGAERMEFQWNESPRFREIATPAPVFDADTCPTPPGPGIGLRLSRAAEATVVPSGDMPA